MANPRIGRPLGSRNGRMPSAGYPEISPKSGAFISGFIEGEATFSIRRQPHGTNHSCALSLACRADDEPLLLDLAAATDLGTIGRIPARGSSHPQAVWTVCAKSDCRRLIEILDRYPLRGRKSRDYAIWRAAVNWWIGVDITRGYRNRDWAPMIDMKRRLEEQRRYASGVAPSIRDVHPGLAHDWAGFLAGFWTAEASMGIHRNGEGFIPKAHISVRADDQTLLRELQTRALVGTFYLSPGRPTSPSPCATWMIRRGGDLTALVAILDAFPPRGRKGREYAIWRQAALEFAGRAPRGRVRQRLSELRPQLAQARNFRPA